MLVTRDVHYDIPQHNLKNADFGCLLAHREAWKRIALYGQSEWAVVLEDDSPPVSYQALMQFPPIPTQCDFTIMSNNTAGKTLKICDQPHILRILNGYSTCGYIIHRDGAKRLLAASSGGWAFSTSSIPL